MALNFAALFALALVNALVASSAGVAQSADDSDRLAGFPEVQPGGLKGYLDPTGLPNSLALLPPPPSSGSPAFASDEAARLAAAKLQDTPRWRLAISDADLQFPHAAETFSCATGLPISKDRMPRLYTLLNRTLRDFGFSTYLAKTHYDRVRPFAMYNGTVCTPSQAGALRKDGSYPSGHSASGWGWALLMTEIVPERTDSIMMRGWEFGQSRVICNAHWQSDVDNGRIMGAATIARLHSVPAFNADLNAAKSEVEVALAEGAAPAAEACATEAGSLNVKQ